MRRASMALLLIVALVATACGGQEDPPETEATVATGGGDVATEGPDPAGQPGSGHDRDDDCIQLTRGETAEVIALDNMFAPECPILVDKQVLRIKNLGVRNHTFTVSENQDDQTPFLMDLAFKGESSTETDGPLSDYLEPGTYEFFCKLHSGMDGVMEILPAAV